MARGKPIAVDVNGRLSNSIPQWIRFRRSQPPPVVSIVGALIALEHEISRRVVHEVASEVVILHVEP